ncbi:MAG: ATP synthase F0 subunit B [Actinomycetota bacterium]|nr:ATP synthase F0 subunit B [Actinomycetota bacterium]
MTNGGGDVDPFDGRSDPYDEFEGGRPAATAGRAAGEAGPAGRIEGQVFVGGGGAGRAREGDAQQRGSSETVDVLRHLLDIVETAKSVPLSASVLVSRDELAELLEEALEKLPEELERARWILRDRDELLGRARREGEEIVEEARVQAERMVQRTEIVRQANHMAQRVVDDARAEARRLRMEADDYCDQKLAAFEIVLDRTMKTVQAGRSKLHETFSPPLGEQTLADEEEPTADGGFFDQDHDRDQG